MKPETHDTYRLAGLTALLVGMVLVLLPAAAGAVTAEWLDEISALTLAHKELAKMEGRDAAYDRILDELGTVRFAVRKGDREGTYVAMNHLMDTLEKDTKGGGLPIWSAKTIFDFCGKVTPMKYHDAARHTPERTKAGFDYWADEVFDPGDSG